ncbi:MAG TPA: hypothetical protein VN962_13390 [Polyangia bacterium]|nr:hypothetical protein [Polyangia bacterium]
MRFKTAAWRIVLAPVVSLIALGAGRPAHAYTWMIRYGHQSCVSCHVDPSGGGLLTDYGRDQGADLLRTRWSSAPDDTDALERRGRFLWGAVHTPDWLLLGGAFRPAILTTQIPQVSGGTNTSSQAILMQGDLRAGIRAGGWRGSASLGIISNDSYASLAGQLVSREHWVGYAWDGDTYTLRAGRLNLPYGLRIIEHDSWVRAQTRTDINDQQQHGIAFAWDTQRVRAEAMGILGNYQISPDAVRERGYSAYAEVTPAAGYAVGASSLVTHAARDIQSGLANTRQAHGLFVRVGPWVPLAVLAEGDVVVQSPSGGPHATGLATLVQADVEPLQGVHVIGTGESWRPRGPGTATSYGAWGSLDWFVGWHTDVRFDYIWRSMALGGMRLDGKSWLAQLHVYL